MDKLVEFKDYIQEYYVAHHCEDFEGAFSPLLSVSGICQAVLDEILVAFLVSRKLDFESAAKRYFKFVNLVVSNSLVMEVDDDVLAGLSVGVFHFYPPTIDSASGGPVITVIPRNMNWSKVTTQQIKKAWFYAAMTTILHVKAAQNTWLL